VKNDLMYRLEGLIDERPAILKAQLEIEEENNFIFEVTKSCNIMLT